MNALSLEVVHAWFMVGYTIGNHIMTLPNQSQQYVISTQFLGFLLNGLLTIYCGYHRDWFLSSQPLLIANYTPLLCLKFFSVSPVEPDIMV